jgi:hypothetical protein
MDRLVEKQSHASRYIRIYVGYWIASIFLPTPTMQCRSSLLERTRKAAVSVRMNQWMELLVLLVLVPSWNQDKNAP